MDSGAQTTQLTLRQTIDWALGQNPEIAVARAGEKDASASSFLARTALLPQLNFTEEISRGNDPFTPSAQSFGSSAAHAQQSEARTRSEAENATPTNPELGASP
jgi:outer membrane protein TolC